MQIAPSGEVSVVWAVLYNIIMGMLILIIPAESIYGPTIELIAIEIY